MSKAAFNSNEILNMYNDKSVPSMYDKHLLELEISLIKSRLKPDSKILDAGCGEAEGSVSYSQLKGANIIGVDYSEGRLELAKKNTCDIKNIELRKVDLLGNVDLPSDFDYIISQRFLINFLDWEQQKNVINKLGDFLKKNGRLLLYEGSIDGMEELDKMRTLLGIPPIGVKWNNLFFIDNKLEEYMNSINYSLIEKTGNGWFYFLSRGIKPYFENEPRWDDKFNEICKTDEVKQLMEMGSKFGRNKLWVFQKN